MDITGQNTGNDRYSGKNSQGLLFHYSGGFHYSGRLLYGTQHIRGEENKSELASEAVTRVL